VKIIHTLNAEIVRLLGRPEMRERAFNAGVEVVGSTPERLLAQMKSDIVTLSKVIKDARIGAD
jgi:tripartite-type tricarboxylate transporter receptor subunit TctC